MNSLELSNFFDCLSKVLKGKGPFHLHQPEFSGNEWKYVKECIDTGWVSSVGNYVSLFEEKLQEFTGIKHAIATVNGTAALHVCLELCDVNAEDEILVPTFTFVATANAVSYCQAIPHFIDVNEETLGVDAEKLEEYLEEICEDKQGLPINKNTGRHIKGLIVMHAFGHPAELEEIAKVCKKYNIALIEDAAEALGTKYQDIHVGNWGVVSAVSFNGNKVITTGGGGAILTNNTELAHRAKHITTTAKTPHPWKIIHDVVAHNYRMPNLNAALGCAQMEELPSFIKKKRKLATRYQESFLNSPLGNIMTEPEHGTSNYWLNSFMLKNGSEQSLEGILAMCHEKGVYARPAWELMHRLPMFVGCPKMDLSTAERLRTSLICLPSNPMLEERHD